MRALVAGCALAGLIGQASAETFVEHSAEVRLQLDFVVPDTALRTFLPAGWEPNVAAAGAAKDCSLRMIFIDRVDITRQGGGPAAPGTKLTEEHWEFAAASGERMEVRLTYERAAARKNSNEVKFFSAVNPGFYQTFKIDQGLDIMRNVTAPIRDQVRGFQYEASGGKITALFDGSERVASIDALHWYNRGVYLP